MSRVYRVTFRAFDVDDNSLIQPSLHYQTDVPPLGDEPDPDDVASEVYDLVGTEFLACCSSRITLTELVAREEVLAEEETVPAVGRHGVNASGTLSYANGDLPRELVGIVNIKTGAAIRSGRGYITLPGPYNESFLSSRIWASTYFTVLAAFAAKLDDQGHIGTVQITDLNPVVYSKTRRKAGKDPWTFRVTGGVANARPHWRRSRGNSP